MGYTLGMPSLKLSNTAGKGGKHCGNFKKVTEEALKERLGQDLDINHDLTQNNEYLTEIKTAAELQNISETWIRNYNARIDKENIQIEEEIKKAVKEYNDTHEDKLTKVKALKAINDERRANKEEPLQTKRHIRDDAVVMCATIIKPSAAFMSTLNAEEQRKILLDAYDKLKEIVGKPNMKAAVIHYDELVPHLHTFWMPETEDGRLCAKEMHNLKFLGTLNKEMPAFLRSKGWDIDDCNAYDAEEEQRKREEMGEEAYKKEKQEKRNNQGRSSSKFKHEIQKDIEKLNEEIETLNKIESNQFNSIEKNNKLLRDIDERYSVKKEYCDNEIKKMEKKIDDLEHQRRDTAIKLYTAQSELNQTIEEKNKVNQELLPLKEELEYYAALKLTPVKEINLNEKPIPFSDSRVSVDVEQLRRLKEHGKAYRINFNEILNLRKTDAQQKNKEKELNERENKLSHEKEMYESLYDRQYNLNKLLERTEYKKESAEFENGKLKEEVKKLKEKVLNLEATVEAMRRKIVNVYSHFANAIKAVGMLKYSKKEQYKANLTDEQGTLIDAIEKYGENLMRKDNLNDLADDIFSNVGLCKSIKDEMEKLNPIEKNQNYEYGGMSR